MVVARRRTRTPAARVAAALLAVGAATAAADAVQQPQVRIEARQVVAPADGRLVLSRGTPVTIRWQSDEAVELHLHGYDLLVKLAAGIPASTPFDARATGRFPVTHHGFGEERGGHQHGPPLLWIEVHPR